MDDRYKDYHIIAHPIPTVRKKWAVSVEIRRDTPDGRKSVRFSARDGIEYILEVEAAKESLNLGRRMIDRERVGF